MTADPYYVAAWDDPVGKMRHLEAQLAQVTAERDALAAEVERMTTALCSALLHDARGGRVGVPLVVRGVAG